MTAVRLLMSEDFALWKAIRLEALAEHPHAYGKSFEESSLLSDEEWARMLEDSYIFAYFSDELPVGVAGYFRLKGEKRRHRATVFTVYVRKEFRGRGVMDWLIDAIVYHARDLGVEQLHLDVGTYNASAIRCYERNGFTLYGTDPRALKVDGTYVDEHLMVRYL